MRLGQLGAAGPAVPVLGLGCSHIASLSTRASARQIASLLDQAYDLGVRVFDTADIYGQGDSERRLARIAARPGTVLCTKAGLDLSMAQSLIGWVKPVLRPILHRVKGAPARAGQLRRESEVTLLDPATLEQRLEASLRRLRRDEVELFLLHSPPIDLLADGALYDALDRVRDRGLAQRTGVSCRSIEDAARVVASGRAQVIQVPLDVETIAAADPMLAAAQKAGIGVVAREVLRPVGPQCSLRDALQPLVQDRRIDVVLCGTTSADHLAQNVALVQAG